MNRWKQALKARFYWTSILCMLGLLFLIGANCISQQYKIIINIANGIGGSLISAGITIFLIKFDIMDALKTNSMDEFGVLDIVGGRDDVFSAGYDRNIDSSDWKGFMEKSSDKTIDIVGISMYSFFFPNNLISHIIMLAQKHYKIRIVFANPTSEEVSIQSEEEGKPGKLKENIEFLSRKILTESEGIKDIELYYSETLPKAFIVRSGNKMIITPYLLEGPFKVPTIIANDSGLCNNMYYNTYKNYICKVIDSATKIK